MEKRRCDWALGHSLMQAYHDKEWGVPIHDDRKLFELLILEGMQAGLSWLTILKKRDTFRQAFDGFDPGKIARYRQARVERLMKDKGIIRNRLKIESTISNARSCLSVQKELGGFSDYLWGLLEGHTTDTIYRRMRDIPAQTPAAVSMSKALKKRGFRFVGPTICYAFMQATGMVNDHLPTCFRYKEVRRTRGRRK
ncbi:MAG: DNA-3-methyladenine glycosylase I [Planctomycetota bacterium]|nr:DNA-3-methyladenine glycosylase I [Planctomycetota bacterium]